MFAQEDLPEMEGELRLEEEEWEETFVSQEHFGEDDIGMEKIWQVRTNAKSYVVFRFRNLSTVGVCCISNMSKHDQTFLSLLCHYFVSLCIRYTLRHVGWKPWKPRTACQICQGALSKPQWQSWHSKSTEHTEHTEHTEYTEQQEFPDFNEAIGWAMASDGHRKWPNSGRIGQAVISVSPFRHMTIWLLWLREFPTKLPMILYKGTSKVKTLEDIRHSIRSSIRSVHWIHEWPKLYPVVWMALVIYDVS